MKDLVLFCKSYFGDFDKLDILYRSIQEYNIDNIPFYISVPKVSVREASGKYPNATVICDDDVYGITSSSGWIHQQLVKIYFSQTGIAQNYVVIDSDSYFIRPFYVSDFIFNKLNNTPYTVCHEQKELFTWTALHNKLAFDPKQSFMEDRYSVMEHMGRERGDVCLDFGPSPVIWNSNVWNSMNESYLKPNSLTFQDLITTVPSEFTWYGEWLLYNEDIQLVPREPLFKVYHYSEQYSDDIESGVTEEILARNYMGIVLQSNWGNILKFNR